MKIKSLTDLTSVAAYLQRIRAEPRSLLKAVVREQHGKYWKDIAVIKISIKGEVEAPEEHMPSEFEAVQIKNECQQVEWPELNKVQNLINLPDQLKNAGPEDIFVFRDLDGLITMVQQRIINSDGSRLMTLGLTGMTMNGGGWSQKANCPSMASSNSKTIPLCSSMKGQKLLARCSAWLLLKQLIRKRL